MPTTTVKEQAKGQTLDSNHSEEGQLNENKQNPNQLNSNSLS